MALPALLGLISDTHGLLRPEAIAALQGSELILHAGDVGDAKILDELRAIAPVVAVCGNIDTAPWAQQLPATASIEADGAKILMLHNLHELDIDPAVAGYQIVISGHSHKPGQCERAGVLYINPGSAGPRRFKLPVMVSRLDLHRRPWQAEFVSLSA